MRDNAKGLNRAVASWLKKKRDPNIWA